MNGRSFRSARIALRAGLAAAAVAGSVLASGSVASAATGPSTGAGVPDPAQFCVVVLGEAMGAKQDSPVLYQHCAASAAEASSRLVAARVPRAGGGTVTPLSSDLLMTWWTDLNFGGNYSAIYGSSGTCDSAGYRITPSSYWQTRLSSITGGGQCNEVDVYARSLTYADDFALPVGYIGNTLNDNVGRVQVYNL